MTCEKIYIHFLSRIIIFWFQKMFYVFGKWTSINQLNCSYKLIHFSWYKYIQMYIFCHTYITKFKVLVHSNK